MRGDYVESLPRLLARPPRRRAARRLPDRIDDVRRAWRAWIASARRSSEASRDEPLVYVGGGNAPDDAGFALDVERYPGGGRQRLGVFDFHGEWLDWGR